MSIFADYLSNFEQYSGQFWDDCQPNQWVWNIRGIPRL